MSAVPESNDKIVIFKHSRTWSGDRCSRLLREQGYQVDWCYPHEDEPLPEPDEYLGAVIFGSRNSVNDNEAWIRQELDWVEKCLQSHCAFLGICFGAQLLAKVLGSKVWFHPENLTEIGFTEIYSAPQFRHSLNLPEKVFQWHKEGFDLPADTSLLCSSDRFPNQAFKLTDRTYGLQFHPEVNHTVISQWFDNNQDYEAEGLDRDSRARQLEYARRHDDSISKWFYGFLKSWLKD